MLQQSSISQEKFSAFSCSAGHYLDFRNQACLKCPPGSYSLGSGQRYERLMKWPPGFSVENYPDPTGQVFNRDSPQMHCPSGFVFCFFLPIKTVCLSSGWVIEEGEIRYQPTSCISKLSISLQLVQNGYIEFTMKMPKNNRGLVSNIDVRNEQCQSYANQLASSTPSNQDESLPDWRLKKISLKRGHNLVTWTIANNIEMTTLADIIYVPKIDIIGLPYTSSCTLCPAGTFSDVEGKEFCENCPANFFSEPGAKTCNPCSSFQYSSPRSSTCKQKPSCESIDYHPVFDSCRNGQQKVDYGNLQPIICQEFLPTSVKVNN